MIPFSNNDRGWQSLCQSMTIRVFAARYLPQHYSSHDKNILCLIKSRSRDGKKCSYVSRIRSMTLDAILTSIDEQISKLQQARAVLTDGVVAPAATKGPGRPKKTAAPAAAKAPKKRVMSEEARARIAAAQKKRWAATKRAAK
jgi:hypothetical protein